MSSWKLKIIVDMKNPKEYQKIKKKKSLRKHSKKTIFKRK